MIKTVKSIAEIALIAMIIILAIRFCSPVKPPDGVWVSQEELDSIKNIPPDTVVNIDTFIIRDTIVRWFEKKPPPPESYGDLNFYKDSLVNDELAIYINDSIQGTLSSRQIGYKLFVPLQIEVIKTVEITKPIPYPVKPQPESHFIGLLGVGEMFSIELLYQNKKNIYYGAEAMRFQGRNYYMGKIGINLK